MYINPKYADQVQVPRPPAETGRRLATFGRGHDEFRVTLSTYEGHDFLRLQQWAPDRSTGEFWPVKGKGCSIRLTELAGFRDAISALIAELDLEKGHGRVETRPHHGRSNPAPRPQARATSGLAYSSKRGFDEVG